MRSFRNWIQACLLKFKSGSSSSKREFVPFEEMRRVVMFCDESTNDISEVLKFSNLLLSFNIKPTILAYIPNISLEDSNSRISYVRSVDLSVSGELLDNELKDIFFYKYDALFDLRASSGIISDFLVKRLKACFVVACSSNITGADILISTAGDVSVFASSSIELLKKLKKS